MSDSKTYYVDNKHLFEELSEYKRRVIEYNVEKIGKKPRLPDYVAYAIMEIPKQLAKRPNFYNYTFKEEMIGDAIENCIQYIDNFNPEKSTNAFGYISLICWNAFIRRIRKEKTQHSIVYRILEQSNVLDVAQYFGEDIPTDLLESMAEYGLAPNAEKQKLNENINNFGAD